MLFPKDKLIVFAKAPIPGQVKKRLIPALGAENAAKLHQEMLEKKLRTVNDNKITHLELYCWPDKHHPYFQEIQSRYSLQLYSQQGADLGERMANAMRRSITEQGNAVLIGTDSPPLDNAYLIQAFQALQDGADAVVGPAEDGGYILLGLSRFDNAIFKDIDWGEKTVFNQTALHLTQLDFNWVELETLWDVDRPEDLERVGIFM